MQRSLVGNLAEDVRAVARFELRRGSRFKAGLDPRVMRKVGMEVDAITASSRQPSPRSAEAVSSIEEDMEAREEMKPMTGETKPGGDSAK